jgi:plastocyanin
MTVGITFDTNTITVKAGEKVDLAISNCATFGHNFTSPSLKVEPVTIGAAAADVPVSFTAPTTPGKYMFWCTIASATGTHGERGMTGEIIVQ